MGAVGILDKCGPRDGRNMSIHPGDVDFLFMPEHGPALRIRDKVVSGFLICIVFVGCVVGAVLKCKDSAGCFDAGQFSAPQLTVPGDVMKKLIHAVSDFHFALCSILVRVIILR